MSVDSELNGSSLYPGSKPSLEDSVEILDEDWEKDSSSDHFSTFETGASVTDRSTRVNGDRNVWHVPEGIRDYESFIEEVVEMNERQDKDWQERRNARELGEDNFWGSVLPGMKSTEEYLREETRRENAVKSFNSTFVDPMFTGDNARIIEGDGVYKTQAQAPQHDDWTTTVLTDEVEYGDFNPDYNREIFGVVSQMVAREDRDFDMLVEVDLEIYDEVDFDDLEWNTVEPVNESLEEDKMNRYSAEIEVDGQEIGKYSETYIEAQGEEIKEKYEDSGFPAKGLDAFTPLGATANWTYMLNSMSD